MSDKPISKGRRGAIKMMMGGLAAVPLMNLAGIATVQTEDMPKVDEAKDPTAIALKYKHDAAKSERATIDPPRPGKSAEEQSCKNCQFIQANDGDWRPCQLFPGKTVAAEGWCASWTLKPGA